MKQYKVLIVLLFIISGCTSIKDKSDEAKLDLKYIESLEAQVVSLQTEVDNQKKEISNFVIKAAEDKVLIEEKDANIEALQKPLSDDENKFIDFYKRFYPGNMYRGKAGSRIMVDINYYEPLRIGPSELSPYLTTSKLTYSNEIEGSNIIEAEFLYTSIGETGEYWCLVVLDNMVGYVKESSIIDYSYNDISYSALEEFADLKLGVTVETIIEIFGNKVQYEDSPNGYDKALYISLNGLSYDDDNGESITYGYNPNTRIVDFIRVGTGDYPLESGFKVGDRLDDVFSYYDGLYPNITEDYVSVGLSNNDRVYDIGNGYTLSFNGRDGLVIQIIINHGYNIYT